jgi:hypothetical protein
MVRKSIMIHDMCASKYEMVYPFSNYQKSQGMQGRIKDVSDVWERMFSCVCPGKDE